MPKNIIFVSDLHLGAGEVNDFHSSYHLHRLFDYAEGSVDELVICGDFLELLQSEFFEIYAKHRLIFDHLFDLAKKIPVKYIFGNHDAAVAIDFNPREKSHFLGSKIEVLPDYENLPLKLFAAHGHQYSLVNSRDDILDISEISAGDRITKIVGWCEKNIHPKIDNLFEKGYIGYKKFLRRLSGETKKFAELVTPAHPDYRKLGGDFSEYIRGARDVLNSPRYSLCIFGHTHLPRMREFEEGIYANCGSWVGCDPIRTPPTFLEVNADFVKLIDAQTFEILENFARRNKKEIKFQKVQTRTRRNVFV